MPDPTGFYWGSSPCLAVWNCLFQFRPGGPTEVQNTSDTQSRTEGRNCRKSLIYQAPKICSSNKRTTHEKFTNTRIKVVERRLPRMIDASELPVSHPRLAVFTPHTSKICTNTLLKSMNSSNLAGETTRPKIDIVSPPGIG